MCFIYNSSNLNQLDSFSSNSGINVMIINTQAFAASLNEDKNVEGRKGDAAARIIYPADLGADEPGGGLQGRGAIAAVLVSAVDGIVCMTLQVLMLAMTRSIL